jgi:hypothetical protein
MRNDVIGKWREAVWRVCDALDEYEGEVIIKNEHPIHWAVQDLEKLCVRRRGHSVTQPCCLPSPLSLLWYSLLDTSRNRGVRFKHKGWSEVLPKARKRRAVLLAMMMKAMLQSMEAMVGLVERTDGNLPLDRSRKMVKQ